MTRGIPEAAVEIAGLDTVVGAMFEMICDKVQHCCNDGWMVDVGKCGMIKDRKWEECLLVRKSLYIYP
jgi:hypothetical protein